MDYLVAILVTAAVCGLYVLNARPTRRHFVRAVAVAAAGTGLLTVLFVLLGETDGESALAAGFVAGFITAVRLDSADAPHRPSDQYPPDSHPALP